MRRPISFRGPSRQSSRPWNYTSAEVKVLAVLLTWCSSVRMLGVKPVVKFVLVICVAGLIGWRVIRALSGAVTMKQLRRLLGNGSSRT